MSESSQAPADWVPAPNIHNHPELYELENRALQRDGRLDEALAQVADWADRALLDLGCGTGFWLSSYARRARRVVGVEPDPTLQERLLGSHIGRDDIEIRQGSAESIPLEDESVDVVHARFAYFFGPGSERGLAEVMRVLRPGGMFVAIDNSWRGGEFAQLLTWSTEGNGAMDPEAIATWWEERGARRVEVEGGWQCESPEQLEAILRIEFPADVVDRFVASREPSASITYRFALYVMERAQMS